MAPTEQQQTKIQKLEPPATAVADQTLEPSTAALPTLLSTGPWREALGAPTELLTITSPVDGATLGYVEQCGPEAVDAAVSAARAAQPGWAGLTMKRRAAIMMRFHALVTDNQVRAYSSLPTMQRALASLVF